MDAERQVDVPAEDQLDLNLVPLPRSLAPKSAEDYPPILLDIPEELINVPPPHILRVIREHERQLYAPKESTPVQMQETAAISEQEPIIEYEYQPEEEKQVTELVPVSVMEEEQVVEVQPEIRDLKKEVSQFVPLAVRKKHQPAKGSASVPVSSVSDEVIEKEKQKPEQTIPEPEQESESDENASDAEIQLVHLAPDAATSESESEDELPRKPARNRLLAKLVAK